MKTSKLPGDAWSELSSRLRNYAEEPDEGAWENIARSIPAQEPKWIAFVKSAAGIAAVAVYALLIDVGTAPANQRVVKNQINQQEEVGNEAEKTSDNNQTNSDSNQEAQLAEQNQKKENIEATTKEGNRNAGASSKKGQRSRITNPDGTALARTNAVAGVGASDVKEGKSTMVMMQATNHEIIVVADSIQSDSLVHDQEVATAQSTRKEEETEKKKSKKNFSVYTLVNPQLNYQRVIPLANDQIVVDDFVSKSIFSAGRLGIAFEAGLTGKLSKKFEYYAGVSYYSQNQTLTYYIKSLQENQVQTTGNFLFQVAPAQSERSFSYSMKNVGLSTGMLYHIRGEKLMHKMGVGVQYQKGLKKIEGSETYNNAQSQYLLYQLFYRNEYRVSDVFHVFVQPNFSHAFVAKEELAEPFKLKPYRVGLSIGAVYHF